MSAALIDRSTYQVQGGQKHHFLFYYSFGHKRPFLNPHHYRPDLHGPITPIAPEIEATLPQGPFMPTGRTDSAREVLERSLDLDYIREIFCREFTGSGYEIGAGERPTSVPVDCDVTYIDKFTFEEAADGSFVNKSGNSLVRVTFQSAMHELTEIHNETADFFIACHVIEHVHDVIASFRNVHRKLRKGGMMFLAIPDKRFIFDETRPTTTLEHFVADDLSSEVPMLEHYLEYARRALHDGQWTDAGLRRFKRGADIHFHTFTPSSMTELLSHLDQELAYSDYSVFEHSRPIQTKEFYVTLKK